VSLHEKHLLWLPMLNVFPICYHDHFPQSFPTSLGRIGADIGLLRNGKCQGLSGCYLIHSA
ncbi:MAG: hypothetical protein ACUZ77_10930, partial [Candidatus Brocadiales bacterium]